MKAIILAAGQGTRLYPMTLNRPKGLLSLGESTLLDRLVEQLKALGVEDILMVVGHNKEVLVSHFVTGVRFRNYDDYDSTNNLHTLWSVKDELNDDVLISFADLVLDQEIINNLINCNNDFCFAVDTSDVLEATMRVEVGSGVLKSITRTPVEKASGNFIGISKISKSGCLKLVDEMANLVSGHKNDYYTIAVDNLIKSGEEVYPLDIKGKYWCEIDTKNEYDKLIDDYKNGIFR